MIEFADVIVDLQAGDTGKGKVAHDLCKKENYTHVVRYNGGGNAGHTVFHNGEKVVTHFIPVGVLHNIKSIIGPGCIVNPKRLLLEIETLERLGINVRDYLYIDKRAHITLDEYLIEDSQETAIGTTKTGNGPTYRNKYNRTGARAESVSEINNFLIDIYEEFHGELPVKILFEGAQGFELDIDWGDYPYVTSSHCTVGSAILNGVPPQKIRNIYGIIKAYRTYVGAKNFETPSEIFDEIRKVGSEYGATTGRPRQINWLNLDDVIKGININGVNNLIINKLDVLEQVNNFNIYYNTELRKFDNANDFSEFIINEVSETCEHINKERIIFSFSPFKI